MPFGTVSGRTFGGLLRICGIFWLLMGVSGAQAARLVVDIRFETTDQSIWGNGAAATLPGYVSGNQLVLDNGDLAAIGVNLSNLDLVVVNAGLNFRAGLDVGLSGDAAVRTRRSTTR